MKVKEPKQIPFVILMEGIGIDRRILLDNRPLDIKASRKVIDHSEGFNWGYGGSGPAQLALAILLKYLNKKDAKEMHQDFKSLFLTALDNNFVAVIKLREFVQRMRATKAGMEVKAVTVDKLMTLYDLDVDIVAGLEVSRESVVSQEVKAGKLIRTGGENV